MLKTKSLELSYDEEGDILYVSFLHDRPAAYQSLTDNIVVRFDPQTLEPIGLTLIDFSVMAPAASPAPRLELYRLAQLPLERRKAVLSVLAHPTMSQWLEVSASATESATWYASIRQPKSILDLLHAA